MKHYLDKRNDLQRIRSGEKKAIIEWNQDFQTGDVLVFQEFDSLESPIDQFEGAITHVQNECRGVRKKFCIISFKLLPDA